MQSTKRNHLIRVLDIRHLSAGFLIGAANTLPGISGGSVALILGVYERLIGCIAAIGVKDIWCLWRPFALSAMLKRIDLGFMASIAMGMAIGILSFSAFIPFLMDNHAAEMNALFFGLLAASTPHTFSMVKGRFGILFAIITTLFAIATFFINDLSLGFENKNMMFQFICGALAILAMLLPGISGSFVMVLMGNYRFVMGEVSGLLGLKISSLLNLLPFIAGAAFGMIFFTRLINRLLIRFRDGTLSALLGMLIGSLPMLWPFSDQEHHKALIPQAFGIDELIIAMILLGGFFVAHNILKSSNGDRC